MPLIIESAEISPQSLANAASLIEESQPGMGIWIVVILFIKLPTQVALDVGPTSTVQDTNPRPMGRYTN
jgi:hypothetical protein